MISGAENAGLITNIKTEPADLMENLHELAHKTNTEKKSDVSKESVSNTNQPKNILMELIPTSGSKTVSKQLAEVWKQNK